MSTRQAESSAECRPQRLSTNVRWTLIATTAYSVSQWLQVVVLARTMGATAVGTYAYALALSAPPMLFASLQMRILAASDALRRYAFREYRSLTFLTSFATILGIAAVGFALGDRAGGGAVLGPVCLMRTSDALADVEYGFWQRCERMSVIAWSRLLQSASSLALVCSAAAAGWGVEGVALGAAAGSVAALVYVRLRSRSDKEIRAELDRAPPKPVLPRLCRLALEGLPLGLILLLVALQANVPRYFIAQTAGQHALGFFAATIQLTNVGNVVVGALGAAAVPRLAALCASEQIGAFRALTRKLLLLAGGLGVAGVALSTTIGRLVLAALYRPEFEAAHELLVVLSLATSLALLASIQGYALTAARIVTAQPLILGASLTVLCGACVVLVPRFGYVGGAWALFAGYAVQVAVSATMLRRSTVESAHQRVLAKTWPPDVRRQGEGSRPQRTSAASLTASGDFEQGG